MIKNLILGLLCCLVGTTALAIEKQTVPIKIVIKNPVKPKIPRSPVNLPIEVTYDAEAQTIEVFCVNDVDAEVYVYNSSDELEDYSPQLNSILSVSNSDYHTIMIEAEDWIGTGVVE